MPEVQGKTKESKAYKGSANESEVNFWTILGRFWSAYIMAGMVRGREQKQEGKPRELK